MPAALPQATSTPVVEKTVDTDSTSSGEEAPTRGERGGKGGHIRRHSSSSDDLTNVSNISSHEYGIEDDEVFPISSVGYLNDGPLTLSDVRVDLNQPPPVPSTPPPDLDVSGKGTSTCLVHVILICCIFYI